MGAAAGSAAPTSRSPLCHRSGAGRRRQSPCRPSPTDDLTDPADWPDLARTTSAREQIAPLVLGHGSNVIAADAGHPGTVVVVRTRGITSTKLDDTAVAVTVQAGHPLTDLVQWAAAERLAGLECPAGIPPAPSVRPRSRNLGSVAICCPSRLVHFTDSVQHHGADEEAADAVGLPSGGAGNVHWWVLAVDRTSTSCYPRFSSKGCPVTDLWQHESGWPGSHFRFPLGRG
ncbi:FAD-binding protein [Kitasatospora sp. NPDC097691]|uniref:FAD-binding protein n=1 Tax=Kitasatospora sp. NPDC097691 TaxID=3157231 RepID=UPI00331949C2